IIYANKNFCKISKYDADELTDAHNLHISDIDHLIKSSFLYA
ncbi:hypothetical protein AAA799E16_00707, partial [Marine Group I thaumarchaeote SCGC AAA799-E16]